MLNPHLLEPAPTDLNQEIQNAQEKHNSAYRDNITESIHKAIDDYYHAGMNAEEVKKIVTNVTKKAPEPSLFESVRFLIP
jgi:uncharacterized protein YeeX (DUF496 family)